MDLVSELTEYIELTYNAKVEHPFSQYPDYITFKDSIIDKWFALIMKVERGKLEASKAGSNSKASAKKLSAADAQLENAEAVDIDIEKTHDISKNGIEKSYGGEVFCINLKAEPVFVSDCVHRPGYFRGYHMNKDKWITILLDGTVPIEEIKDCIDRSFNLVTDSPTRRIYEAVKKVPKGHVATYSQIAAMAGNPKMQRAVGNALHKNPDGSNIPCFRVVNSKGELSGAFAFGGKAGRLQADGVEVVKGKVDLKKYGI